MLSELNISNFAIIERQTIGFSQGLNVITGETGAGKSIVLQALQFLLGGKLKNESVRIGANELSIEGLFNLKEVASEVIESLPDYAKEEELLISRSLTKEGKSKVYINGKLGTVALLQDISSKLINICGQSHHIRLLEPEYHLTLVDTFGGLEELVKEVEEGFTEWKKIKKQVEDLEKNRLKLEEEEEKLNEIVQELSKIKLEIGLREKLQSEIQRAGNFEKLKSSFEKIQSSLEDEGSGVISSLKRISYEVSLLEKIDPSLKTINEEYIALLENLKSFSKGITKSSNSLVVNEAGLDEKREILAEVARLERKYKRNDQELIKLLSESSLRLKELVVTGDQASLIKEEKERFEKLKKITEKLSKSRKKVSLDLINKIKQEFSEVKLTGASFDVDFKETEVSKNGSDRIEFLLSANKGQPLKPLKSVASGGELSRITLILKTVLNDKAGVNVLVFDEVDTGISGAVARAVGKKLQNLGKRSQVLCITHLAQVASLADVHFYVDKVVGKETLSMIKEIKGDERINEVARLVAGNKVTESSRAAARELIEER